MKYYVSRSGQQFGPYSLADLQRYRSQGNVVGTDYGRSSAMQQWVPVDELLNHRGVPAAAPLPSNPTWSNYSAQPHRDTKDDPLPPSLHWGWCLLLALVTVGFFGTVWIFIQANWAKKIDRTNGTAGMYALSLCLAFAGSALFSAGSVMGMQALAAIGSLAYLAGVVCFQVGAFAFKATLEKYCNSVEDLKHDFSGVMTFFFNWFYFEYHLHRIFTWRTTGRLG